MVQVIAWLRTIRFHFNMNRSAQIRAQKITLALPRPPEANELKLSPFYKHFVYRLWILLRFCQLF